MLQDFKPRKKLSERDIAAIQRRQLLDKLKYHEEMEKKYK